MKMYAIFSWDFKNGPIKSWSHMQRVQIHNGRLKPIAHGVDEAPGPTFLIGTPDISAEVRKRLIEHGLDPDRVRQGGVIAHEAYISASPDFFYSGTHLQQQERLAQWVKAQKEFVTGRYGLHRIASMVLHQDEQTPHIHVVVIPLKLAPDGRRKDCSPRWGLDNQLLTARAELFKLQTDYGKAMAPFGLSRGEENSERKHQPYSVVMSDLQAQRAALELREHETHEREKEIEVSLIRLRDGWRDVEEKAREAAAARSAVIMLMKDVEEREARVREGEAELQQAYQLLRDQNQVRSSGHRLRDMPVERGLQRIETLQGPSM